MKGDLYHIWHGDINKRDYFNRIVNFTSKAKKITIKDKNGLYVTKEEDSIRYMKNYFAQREVPYNDDGFLNSMLLGYMTNSTVMGTALGGNISGAIIGDMLNDSENKSQDNVPSEQVTNNDSTDVNNTNYSGSTFS